MTANRLDFLMELIVGRQICPRTSFLTRRRPWRRRRQCLSFLLRKPRRQRQHERHQAKVVMSRTMAVHVRYKSLYIPLPSSAKQQREMTKFCVVWRT